MTYTNGPLPQWQDIWPDGPNGSYCYYEAEGEDGRTYRLWRDKEAETPGQLPQVYRLAPRDDLANAVTLHLERGSGYQMLDRAGMIIARNRARADTEGARRQLGLDE